jgi:hypothetical protein
MYTGGVPGEKCCSSLDQTNILYLTVSEFIDNREIMATHWLKPNYLNAEKTSNKCDDESRVCSNK